MSFPLPGIKECLDFWCTEYIQWSFWIVLFFPVAYLLNYMGSVKVITVSTNSDLFSLPSEY